MIAIIAITGGILLTLSRVLRKLHKITAVVVGVQIVLWMISGLYMTAVPIEVVRGQTVVATPAPQPINEPDTHTLSAVLVAYPDTNTVEMFMVRGRLVYRLTGHSQPIYIDATSGTRLPYITQEEARDTAQNAFQKEADIASVVWIDHNNPVPEFGNRELPAWQVTFDDIFSSTMYVSANTSQVLAVRTDIWRLFDFLWMLHIMDYETRSNFNNPLVILMASVGTLLSLSGMLLLMHAIRRKRGRFWS